MILAFQLWPKMVSANQIPVFFNRQWVWKESIDLLDFLDGDNHHKLVASETITFGWVWSVYLPSNQIAGFFQCLWKESINILDFFMEIIIKEREHVCNTTTFGWLWSIVPLVQTDCKILSSFLEEIREFGLRFFAWR